MATAADMIANFEKLDIRGIATAITERNKDHVTSKVKNQLWNGQKPDGSPITPSYLDDPFFKTRKQAEGYANWKFSGGYGRNTTRSKYTPNLYINGYFYSGIDLTINNGSFEVVSHWAEVGSKYKDALGISKTNAEKVIETNIRPAWEVIVEARTGLKFE